MSVSTASPGVLAGTWTIDPAHSEVGFTVRHLMVSKVRGFFRGFSGTITIGDDPTTSAVSVEIDATSIDTNQPQRDAHIRSADFFEVEKYPTWTFVSSQIRPDGDDWVVTGALTIKGVTRPVDVTVEFNGVGPDPYGGTRAGFSATTRINRSDFGVDIQMPLDGGGVVVSERIDIAIEVEAVLNAG